MSRESFSVQCVKKACGNILKEISHQTRISHTAPHTHGHEFLTTNNGNIAHRTISIKPAVHLGVRFDAPALQVSPRVGAKRERGSSALGP